LSAARALAACLALAAMAAHGQSLESVLAPGPVIEGHVKAESDCRKCHIPFNRSAQDGLCLDCHKDVGMDVRTHGGYHGRMKPQACRTCHTEHRGRDAKIVQLDERSFDHALTDFALRGAHAAPKVECRACHLPKKKYREAPGRCVDCHAKKDVHKGRLGVQCADCHGEDDWKKTRFDHSKTRFPLRGLHVPVKCESCHQANRFKGTPLACLGCHRKDDKHKGRYGEKCQTCHSDAGWKRLSFDHDRDTHFALRGKHATTKCDTCHAGFLYRDKLQTACVACHRKDDKHQGTLGAACANCHSERDWRVESFDHAKTRFPLLGKHSLVKCLSCHKSAVFKEAPSTCIGCHRKDDKHKGVLGEKCASCHTERSWKDTKFDHAKTDFPLLGRHARVKCESCHRDADYKRTPKDCLGCHRKDDVHQGQLGVKCESCHDEVTWKKARFDHARTRFPLVGSHLVVACAKCHVSQRYKDARTECAACHARDDVHKKRLGPKCEDCHNVRSWRAWDFDHAKRTRFALDGGHTKLACVACHNRPVDGPPALSSGCASCHRKDDVHDGQFGPQCDRCHVSSSWKTVRRRISMAGWLQ
jgi:hypothetical protein